jgi:hypothetical protein
MSPASIAIARRFSGPPNFGNGGYAAGLIACAIDPAAARGITVRLAQPLPLETALAVVARADGWDVRAGDALIATARETEPVASALPTPPAHATAEACARAALAKGSPRFSGCFVCGAARAEGDGLRIFSGKLAPDVVAAPWTPAADLAGGDGHVAPEFLWAALDCPGYFASFQDERYALLGEFSVRLSAPVQVAAPHVIVGWAVSQQGRKRVAATALFDAAGSCRAQGIATWIAVDA